MNAAVKNEYFLRMNEYLTREEIQEMIHSGVREGIVDGLEDWQKKYGLTAAHWVHLDSEFKRTREASNHLTKTAITVVVTVICTLLALGVTSFINNPTDGRSGATVKSETIQR